MTRNTNDVIAEVMNHLETAGSGPYIGESISQLEHSLQAAALAASANACEETILAALLHDIGQFLPAAEASSLAGEVKNMSSQDTGSVGRVGHEKIGQMYLLQNGFSDKVAGLVGSHVAAKRYLCATDPLYHDRLSDASKKSLRFQGGPMDDAEVREWSALPWCADMVRLRQWDDAAKVVDMEVPNTDSYRQMMQRHLERSSRDD